MSIHGMADPVMMDGEQGIRELSNMAQLTKEKWIDHIKLSNTSTEKKDLTREWIHKKLKGTERVYLLFTNIYFSGNKTETGNVS